MHEYAVLIDLTSIQRYIFGSSKLKENIGASFNVQYALNKEFIDTFTNKPIMENSHYKGFQGGGNALFYFNDENTAINFASEFSLKLLIEMPGIIPALTIGKIDDSNFKNDKDSLFKTLFINKAGFIPQVVPLSHGFTSECPRSGYSMDTWAEDGDDSGYVSSVVKSKLNNTKNANNYLKSIADEVDTEFFEEHIFTDSLEDLGSTNNENSHIAVVCIDGNGMGNRFKETKSLEENFNLSESLKSATKESFKSLLGRIKDEFSQIEKEITVRMKKGKKILPIRPIIIGGDDIVFVCDGRMGIYFTQIFLEEFEKQKITDNKPLTACAGVMIVGKKYPFYRAHQLSESLLKYAKDIRKETNSEGSWIDFQISYGGMTGTLKQIRENQFIVPEGNLHIRPYELKKDKSNETDFYQLVKNTARLYRKTSGKQVIPNSKIKELREVMTKGKDSIELFIKDSDARDVELPEIAGKFYHKRIFQDRKTIYLDMMELYEFYPKYKLNGKGK